MKSVGQPGLPGIGAGWCRLFFVCWAFLQQGKSMFPLNLKGPLIRGLIPSCRGSNQ